MAVVGLFYGSDTGNTENISKMIQKGLGTDLVDIRDIAKSSKEDIEAQLRSEGEKGLSHFRAVAGKGVRRAGEDGPSRRARS